MDPLSPLILALHTQGRPRVWSLVITIFGDAVQHRGGRIATLRLQKLLDRIGVESGALRTALSRLTGDGWVIRDRSGRNTFYRLSAMGRAEFQPASTRVYAPPEQKPAKRWTLALGESAPENAIRVGHNAFLIRGGSNIPLPDHMCLTGTLDNFPQAFSSRAVCHEHQAALKALHNDLDTLCELNLPPLDAMAARILLIHRWRRLVLRFPEVPSELLPDSVPTADVRRRVAKAYGKLIPASESWLDCPEKGLSPMPPADPAIFNRFKP